MEVTMSTIIEADENGVLHLPAALLPHPGPRRRYRVSVEDGRLMVAEFETSVDKPWMELAGCISGEREEFERINRVVEEFERVNPEEWD